MGGSMKGFAPAADVPEGARQGQVATGFLSSFSRGFFGILEAVKFRLTDHTEVSPGQWTGSGATDKMHILSPTLPVRITAGNFESLPIVWETDTATGNAGGDPMPLMIGPVPAGEVWRVYSGGMLTNASGTNCDLDAQGVFVAKTAAGACYVPVIDTATNLTVPAVADLWIPFPYITSLNDETFDFAQGYADVPEGYYFGCRIGVDVPIPNTETFTIRLKVRKLKLEV